MKSLVAALAAYALAQSALFVIFPEQDFPTGDDWAYARGAFAFLEGRIDYQHWAAMPLFGQWLWSAPFVAGLGRTHLALHVSTLVLSALGLSAFFDLLRQRFSDRAAALATACLAFNPYWFVLSRGFLSDVPSVAFMLVALAFYARASKSSDWLLLPALLAALLAVSHRQTAVVLPLAALAAGARRWRYRLAAVAPWLLAVPLYRWFGQRADISPPRLGVRGAEILFVVMSVCQIGGMSVLPLALADWRRLLSRECLCAYVIMAALFLSWSQVYAHPFEFGTVRGVCRETGGFWPATAGVLGMTGIDDGGPGDRAILIPYPARLALMALSTVGAGYALVRFCEAGFPAPLPLLALAELVLLCFALIFYDRYILALLPGLLWACAPAPERAPTGDPAPDAGERSIPNLVAGWAGVAFFAAASFALAHDWTAQEAARWELGARLRAQGIDPTDISSGMAWNGWFGGRTGEPTEGGLDVPGRLAFPGISGRYAIAPVPLAGGTVIDRRTYKNWLPPRTFTMLAQRADMPPAVPFRGLGAGL